MKTLLTPFVCLTLASASVCFGANFCFAEQIVFEFAIPADDNSSNANLAGQAFSGKSDEKFSASTVGGILVEISASTNDGTFNKTGTSGTDHNFGINSSTTSDDDTDAFDFNESMTFSFSADAPATISLVSIDFDRLTGGTSADLGQLSFSGGSSQISVSAATTGAFDVLSVSRTLAAGEEITLSHVSGGNFGLESITIDVQLTGVPEPTSLVLFGLAAAPILLRRKRLG